MQEDYSYPNTYTTTGARNVRRIAVVSTLLLLSIIALVWMYNNSFINIAVSSTSNGAYSYKITDQKTGEVVASGNKSGALKKRVPKGDYEVLINQNETSYYKLVDTGPFLQTIKINARLQTEKSRSFVGNFPNSCSYYDQKLLFSYDCEGNADALKIHQAATAATPTIGKVVDELLTGLTIDGIAQAGEKNLVLMGGRLPGEAALTEARIAELSEDFSLKNSIVPVGIADIRQYKIISYKQGFVLYNIDLTDILYYQSLDAEPERITFEPPDDEKLKPFDLVAKKDKLAAIYSYEYDEENFGKNQTSNDDQVEVTKGNTVFQILEDGKLKNFTIKGGYTRALLCGQKNLCVLNGAALTAYDVSGKNPKELFTIQEVRDILNDNNTLVVLREKEILHINLESLEGQIGYSFGNYTNCGGQSVPNGGYILCVSDPRDNKSALYIDTTQQNKDSIDKKILLIYNQSYVDNVSAYKSFIYIVPELGKPVFDVVTKGYTYDSGVRQKAAADIDKHIDSLGIDRSQYTIINTQP